MFERIVLFFGKLFCKTVFLLEVEGQDKVPEEGPVIIACNHVNYADAVIVQLGTKRRVRFIAWNKAFKVPFWGWIMSKFGTIPIDLSKPDIHAFKSAADALKKGEVIGIFPEGTFTPDGHVVSAKKGAARLAINTGAVIVPATLTGAYKAWPRGKAEKRLFPRPGMVKIKFHDPIVLDKSDIETKSKDKEYQNNITNRIMEPIVRRVEPSLKADEKIEKLTHEPAPHIRIYEWLPVFVTLVGAVLMMVKHVARPDLIYKALTVSLCYFAYLVADIKIIPQNRWTKLLRNFSPFALIYILYPYLFEGIYALRAIEPAKTGVNLFSALNLPWPVSWALCDWFFFSYFFMFVYAAITLFEYYFKKYLLFQKFLRGLLLTFYLGLLSLIIFPGFGRIYPLVVETKNFGIYSHIMEQLNPFFYIRFTNFPGIFVLISAYISVFDFIHNRVRALSYMPLVLNILVSTIYLRGFPISSIVLNIGLAYLINIYLNEFKFKAHDGRMI